MEVLDNLDVEQTNKKPNTLLQVMCILGYIANGFWILISLVILVVGSSLLTEFLPKSSVNSEEIISAVYTGFAIFLVLCAVSILGLILAHQKKKSGVIIYGIANGMWAIINFISLEPNNLILGVISVAFIIVIALNYNK